MFNESKLRENDEKFNDVFITENLAGRRAKLLKYIKNEYNSKFVSIHTMNGKIRMKAATPNFCPIKENKFDKGIGRWIIVNSPDDLFGSSKMYLFDIDLPN